MVVRTRVGEVGADDRGLEVEVIGADLADGEGVGR